MFESTKSSGRGCLASWSRRIQRRIWSRVPATIGREGTTMGFGRWERSALKGEFLVLRQWRDGRSRQLDD